jgi:hypothetical protein
MSDKVRTFLRYLVLSFVAWLAGMAMLLKWPMFHPTRLGGSTQTGYSVLQWEGIATIAVLFLVLALNDWRTRHLHEKWKLILGAFVLAIVCAVPASITKIFY